MHAAGKLCCVSCITDTVSSAVIFGPQQPLLHFSGPSVVPSPPTDREFPYKKGYLRASSGPPK